MDLQAIPIDYIERAIPWTPRLALATANLETSAGVGADRSLAVAEDTQVDVVRTKGGEAPAVLLVCGPKPQSLANPDSPLVKSRNGELERSEVGIGFRR